MDLFGRKKVEVSRDLQEIKEAVDIPLPTKEDLANIRPGEMRREAPMPVPRAVPVASAAPMPEEAPAAEERPKQPVAPIFIKLDRYHTILSSLTEVRKGLDAIKNVFAYISELEKMKSESFKMLHDMVAKMDKKLTYLDSEFLRPPGFEAPESQQAMEPGNLEDMISSMRGKIDELRSQIEGI